MSFSVPSGSPPIYSEEHLLGEDVFFLVSMLNGKFLTPGARNSDPITALGDHGGKEQLFQFVRHPDGVVKIWNLAFGAFVSAVGDKWPLQPRVGDEDWSHFALKVIPPNGQLTIRCLHPIAASGPWVSVPLNYPEDARIRVCEVAPREKNSYFQPYAPKSLGPVDADLSGFIRKGRCPEPVNLG
ncbi:hypothetical protein J7E49_06785 [Variovorax paradoxus]|nr:hypothetical protein [Variovorax paradoxus]